LALIQSGSVSPRLTSSPVLREHLRLPGFVLVVAGIEVRERLPIGIPDDVAAGDLVGVPRRREQARWFCHGCLCAISFPRTDQGGLPGFLTLSQSFDGPDL
jgi:hypothetical protein